MKENWQIILIVLIFIILWFILICNVFWFLMWFLSWCDSDRKIAKNKVTWFWYQMTCSEKYNIIKIE